MTSVLRADQEFIPRHWEYFTEPQQLEYRQLQAKVSASSNRNRRNKSAETFQLILDTIKAFVMRGDEFDLKRALLCGVFWVTCFVVVNTRQLCCLLGRSKSSINSSFQSLGYLPPRDANANQLVIDCFPMFKGDYSELRQWTVRVQTNAPNLNTEPKEKHISEPKHESVCAIPQASPIPKPQETISSIIYPQTVKSGLPISSTSVLYNLPLNGNINTQQHIYSSPNSIQSIEKVQYPKIEASYPNRQNSNVMHYPNQAIETIPEELWNWDKEVVSAEGFDDYFYY